MVWVIDKYDEETIRQIERHGDRSAAILAAACLEDRLEQVMRDALDPHKPIVDSMLKGYGPLGSFKSKIDLCYVMGMCPEYVYKMMLRIKDIRNEFAHSPTAKTFASQRISDLCANFPALEKLPKGSKRPRITKEELIRVINEEKERLLPLIIATSKLGKDTPRARYLFTVKFCLYYFFIVQFLINSQRKLSKLGEEVFWPWSLREKPEAPNPQALQNDDRKHKTHRYSARSSQP
jgi:hypothetical protein